MRKVSDRRTRERCQSCEKHQCIVIRLIVIRSALSCRSPARSRWFRSLQTAHRAQVTRGILSSRQSGRISRDYAFFQLSYNSFISAFRYRCVYAAFTWVLSSLGCNFEKNSIRRNSSRGCHLDTPGKANNSRDVSRVLSGQISERLICTTLYFSVSGASESPDASRIPNGEARNKCWSHPREIAPRQKHTPSAAMSSATYYREDEDEPASAFTRLS